MRSASTGRTATLKSPLFAYGRLPGAFRGRSEPCLRHHPSRRRQVTFSCRLTRVTTAAPGNPPVPPTQSGYATSYLWEETWSRDSVLDLVRQFIHEVEEEDENGRKTGRKSLVFPRYQQLDCVRKLISHARKTGAGQRYLIQHSAGSGKTFTIAWLAHQLSTLPRRRRPTRFRFDCGNHGSARAGPGPPGRHAAI